MMVAQHHQTAERRAGDHRLLPGAEQADIGNMEPVRVLRGRDGVDHEVFVQVAGQRQLHEDAMHSRVVVQLVDQRQQVRLRGIGVQLVLVRIHADFDGLLALVADVDLARRVLADQNHGEAGGDAVAGLECGNLRRDFLTNRGGEGFTVYDLGGHVCPLLAAPAIRRARM